MQYRETCTLNIYRAQMHSFFILSGTTYISTAFIRHVHFIFINRHYSCRSKMDKITYLMMNSIHNQLRRCKVPPYHRPACSLISQQRCLPELGMILQGIRELVGLHIARDIQKHSQANTVGFIRPLRSWRR